MITRSFGIFFTEDSIHVSAGLSGVGLCCNKDSTSVLKWLSTLRGGTSVGSGVPGLRSSVLEVIDHCCSSSSQSSVTLRVSW